MIVTDASTYSGLHTGCARGPILTRSASEGIATEPSLKRCQAVTRRGGGHRGQAGRFDRGRLGGLSNPPPDAIEPPRYRVG